MTTERQMRVRRSIQELQDDYTKGNKKPLEDLMRAWKGVKELAPEDPRSFFMLGGFHGEPFRGGGWGSNVYWGGYCNHGNILFPTWHRMYLWQLEKALQSIEGCKDVMLPYWDETSEDSLEKGIPWALTAETFELDGAAIPNPLRSFVFPKNIVDHISTDTGGDSPNYSKPKGYETVRYPLSGLVGTSEDREATAKHNADYPCYADNVDTLNKNIVNWLTSSVVVHGEVVGGNVAQNFKNCLDAPNYTVFSNTSSASQWNGERKGDGSPPVVALESPHNSIHLAVGGYDVPSADFSPIDGANGDMGENDTAGLDPIFFFHHCNIDRVFWLWQRKHGQTDHLEVIDGYPGTNSVDSQGPTPGVAPNAWLTLASPLAPFRHEEDGRFYTSNDCINIERQLGITYSRGSLEELVERPREMRPLAASKSTRALHVSGINRARIRGSFLISAFVVIDGKPIHVGTEAVLSRWNVTGCANCQTHLEAAASFALPDALIEAAPGGDVQHAVVVHGRDGVLYSNLPGAVSSGALALASRRPNLSANRVHAHVEVK